MPSTTDPVEHNLVNDPGCSVWPRCDFKEQPRALCSNDGSESDTTSTHVIPILGRHEACHAAWVWVKYSPAHGNESLTLPQGTRSFVSATLCTSFVEGSSGSRVLAPSGGPRPELMRFQSHCNSSKEQQPHIVESNPPSHGRVTLFAAGVLSGAF